MYGSAFCRAYDAFGWNVYPEVFAQQLWEWLGRQGKQPRSCLDLGCGTGVLCAVLREKGVRCAGVDLSEGMLSIARERCPDVPFFAGDMTAFRPAETFDLVTCTGDALNHVFELSALGRMFRNVYDALHPGGYFVFDLLSEQEIPPAAEPFELDYSETVKARFVTERAEDNVVHLRIQVEENGAVTAREDIRERLHDPAAIRLLLSQAGLRTVLQDHALLPERPHAATWFFAAQKRE